MSTDAVEKFRARAEELRRQGHLKTSRAKLESEINQRAERADRERKDRQPKEKPQAQVGGNVTVIDRYGNKSHFKEGERIE